MSNMKQMHVQNVYDKIKLRIVYGDITKSVTEAIVYNTDQNLQGHMDQKKLAKKMAKKMAKKAVKKSAKEAVKKAAKKKTATWETSSKTRVR